MLAPYVQDQVVSIFKGWTGGDSDDGYEVEGDDGSDDADGGDEEGQGQDEM